MYKPRCPSRVLTTIVTLISLALVEGAKRATSPKRNSAESIVAKNDHRLNGLAIIGIALIALMIPPVLLCIWNLLRDPALSIVVRLLWIRAKELVGFPAPTEKEFLKKLRKERNEQLQREDALRNPSLHAARPPAGPQADDSGAGMLTPGRGPPAGPGTDRSNTGSRRGSAARDDGSHFGGSTSRSQADTIRQRFFDNQPILG